jgi:hypothetical protein
MPDTGVFNIYMLIAYLVIYVLAYFWFAVCLYIIAKKINTPRAWLSWIPFANIYLMCKIAGKPVWWTAVFCVMTVVAVPVTTVSVMLPFTGAAQVPAWYIPLSLVALALELWCVVLTVYIWMAISKARNWPLWLGILMIVPVANVVAPGLLAFSDRAEKKE